MYYVIHNLIVILSIDAYVARRVARKFKIKPTYARARDPHRAPGKYYYTIKDQRPYYYVLVFRRSVY